MDENWWM